MKRLCRLLGFILAFFLLMPAGSSALSLYLKPYAFIDRTYPLLKELVYEVDGERGDAFTATSLDKLTVNGLALVPVRQIRQALDDSPAASFVLIGQRIALIPTRSFPPSLHIFYKELLLFLGALDTFQDGRMELEITKLPRFLASGGMSGPMAGVVHDVEFKALQIGKRQGYLAGEATILCTIHQPVGDQDRVPIPQLQGEGDATLHCIIHQYIPVASLKQAARKGDIIGYEQLADTEINLAMSNDEFIRSGENLPQQFSLKKDVPRGIALKTTDIELCAGVKAGEEVRLTFSKGNIRLQMPGKSYSSAKIGEDVSVGYAATRKKFNGTVTGMGEVKIVIE